jgi:hypothetical protein
MLGSVFRRENRSTEKGTGVKASRKKTYGTAQNKMV